MKLNNSSTYQHPLVIPFLKLSFILLAFLGNYFNYQPFPDVNIIFGSIAVFVAIQLFGVRFGALVALIASISTYALWSNPWDICIFTLEGVIVGLLLKKAKTLLPSVALFWLIVGFPLTLLTYYGEVGAVFTWIVILKRIANGAVNAVVADFIVTYFPVKRWTGYWRESLKPTFSQALSYAFMLFVLVPIIILTLSSIKYTWHEVELDIHASLQAESKKDAVIFRHFIQRHFMALSCIASEVLRVRVGTSHPTKLKDNAELVSGIFSDFHAILILDADGEVTGQSFGANRGNKGLLGQDLSHTISFQALKMRPDAYLSGVVKHDRLLDDYIVVVGVPVIGSGEFKGCILGILDLDRIRKMIIPPKQTGLEVTMLDSKGMIIARSTFGPIGTAYLDIKEGYDVNQINDNLSYWLPTYVSDSGESNLDRWLKSFYIYEESIPQSFGWKIVAKATMERHQNQLYLAVMYGLIMIVLLMSLSFIVAWASSRYLSRPISELAKLTRDLKEDLVIDRASIQWPKAHILEVSGLVDNFKHMAETLKKAFGDLWIANENLEEKVKKRTIELSKAISRLEDEIENHNKTERLLARAQKISRIGGWEKDLKNGELFWSDGIYRIYGFDKNHVKPSYELFLTCVHEDDRGAVEEAIRKAIEGGENPDVEFRIVLRDGAIRYIREQGEIVRDETGKPVKYIGTNQDITDQTLAQIALRESEMLLNSLIEAIPDVIWFKDVKGRWILANSSAIKAFSLDHIDFIGKTNSDLAELVPVHAETLAYDALTDERVWRAKKISKVEEKLSGKDGKPRVLDVIKVPLFNKDGSRRGLVFVGRDITEEKAIRETMDRMVYQDSLTNLPNRILLIDRLNQAITHCPVVAVAILDLDRFKMFNESFGFEFSNLVIKAVADRLRIFLRPADTLARLWSDEFCIVMPDIVQTEDIADVANRLMRVFTKPFKVEGRDLFITASVGMAIYPRDGQDANTLLENSEMAMYIAKESGGNTYQFYTPDLNVRVSEYLLLENSLRKAVVEEDFRLHYQPQISLDHGEIIGTEALIRWDNGELGAVLPAKFIPIAEKTGLIFSIGEWVLRTALKQIKAWHDMGFNNIHVSVNLSAKQFQDPNLVLVIKSLLDETGIHPRYLELEITESTAMRNIEQTAELLNQLRKLGLRIAMDDFGVEYSSLSYIKKFPLDTLKIDQSFIKESLYDPINTAIVKAIIQIAHSLGLKVIAEGVETKEQLIFLHSLKCYGIQGYIFSKPLPPEDFTKVMLEGRRLEVQKAP